MMGLEYGQTKLSIGRPHILENGQQENKHGDECRHEEVGSDGHCRNLDDGLSVWTRGL